MANTNLSDELLRAEGLLVQGQEELALELLVRLAEDAEEYVDRNCPTTDELQWFSFPTLFERLAYRRVERDPRELRDVGEPLDRLYADLALAYVHCGDYDAAAQALRDVGDVADIGRHIIPDRAVAARQGAVQAAGRALESHGVRASPELG